MPVSTALPQIRAGKVRALAILSDERVPMLPDVPTSKQAGVDDFTMPLWYGMFAPAATPRDIVSRLNRELVAVLNRPDVREQLLNMGVEAVGNSPSELGALMKAHLAGMTRLFRDANIGRR